VRAPDRLVFQSLRPVGYAANLQILLAALKIKANYDLPYF